MFVCENLISIILEYMAETRQIYDVEVWRKETLTLPHLRGRFVFSRTGRSFIPCVIACAVDKWCSKQKSSKEMSKM